MPLLWSRPGTKDLNDPAWWERYFRGVRVSPDDGSVTTAKLADEAVTNAKLRDSAGVSVIGRSANTTGTPADIAAAADDRFLVRRAGALGFGALVDADIPATLARDSEVTAAITAHEALSDPHPTYTTAAELAAAVTAHEGSSDPHPTYTTAAELTAALGSYATTSALTAVSDLLPAVGDNYADDTAAASGGIAVGAMYHNAGAVRIRLS